MTDQSAPRYDLGSRIATGGMGEVWKATDTVLDREVAVKLLKMEYADDPGFRSRFQAEARHAAALHHQNVAAVFDFGELPTDDGSGSLRPYLVMELVPGQPLSTLLRDGEPMLPGTAATIVAQAAEGIAAAHALGVVHRDVKPANLLVTPEGTVKVTDFGIARAADGAALTATGQVLGTPAYLSPEQAVGKPATTSSDIYALGVVLYECLAGRRPFQSDTPILTALAHLQEDPAPLPDSVPAPLRDAAMKALAKDPAERIASASDLAAALRGAPLAGAVPAPVPVDDAPTAVHPLPAAVPGPAGDGTRVMPLPPTGPDPQRTRPAWLPWVAAAVAVLMIVIAFALLNGGNDTPTSTGSTGSSATDGASPSDSPSSSPSESPSPSGVMVRRRDYVGLPKDEAKRRLEQQGLKVEEQKVPNPFGRPEGNVVGVSPTGVVQPGQTVTLAVWDKPQERTHGHKGHGKGKKD